MGRRGWGLVVAGALLAGGCGTGGGGDAGVGGSDAQVAASKLPPVSQHVLDQDLADRSVVRLSDLPDGWSVDTSDDDEDAGGAVATEDPTDAQLMACLGVDGLGGGDDDDPTSDSPDFTDGDTGQVTSTAFVTGGDSEAQVAFAVLADEQAQGCYRDLLVQALTADADSEGIEVGEATVEHPTVTTAADETTAIRIVLPVTIAARPFTMNLDFVFVREGRVMGMFTFFDFPDAFSTDVETQILEGPVARMVEAA